MTGMKAEEKKGLTKEMLKAPVKNVRFFGETVSLDFFGNKIVDKIVIKKEGHVAEWSRRHKEVFVDKEFSEMDLDKSFRALCVHEAIEKFLVEKLHLDLDKEAHVVATRKEKEFLESIGGNWKRHELLVYWDWHAQGEH